MTGRAYNAEKLPAKILAYFQANPDEELTYADIAAKFSVSQERARTTVRDLMTGRAKALLESVHVVRLKAKGVRTDG